MVGNLRDKQLQRGIARDFRLSQDQLISWLRCLSYIRNLCAHHARLWNRELSVKPELLPQWKARNVTRDRVYVVFLMSLHLLREIAPDSKWKFRMAEHLLECQDVDLHALRCPPDWFRQEAWNITAGW